MKKQILLVSLILFLVGCKKESDITFTQTCNSSDYAKTLLEASQKLIGSRRFNRVAGGFIANPRTIPIANVLLRFTATNQLTVTVDGDQKTPVSYSLTYGPLPYSNTMSGVQLIVASPITYPGNPGFAMANSVLYVCDQQLMLDYGTAVDGTADIFDRVP